MRGIERGVSESRLLAWSRCACSPSYDHHISCSTLWQATEERMEREMEVEMCTWLERRRSACVDDLDLVSQSRTRPTRQGRNWLTHHHNRRLTTFSQPSIAYRHFS